MSWRGLTVALPSGWTVFEHSQTLLTLADAPLGPTAGDPGERAVAAQLTYEPGASADDWRALVTDQEGTLESDDRIALDDIPATRLVFTFDANGTLTREMVVVVPAREIVILMQPVPAPGDDDVRDVFPDHVAEFQQLLDSIRFGAPVED